MNSNLIQDIDSVGKKLLEDLDTVWQAVVASNSLLLAIQEDGTSVKMYVESNWKQLENSALETGKHGF